MKKDIIAQEQSEEMQRAKSGEGQGACRPSPHRLVPLVTSSHPEAIQEAADTCHLIGIQRDIQRVLDSEGFRSVPGNRGRDQIHTFPVSHSLPVVLLQEARRLQERPNLALCLGLQFALDNSSSPR